MGFLIQSTEQEKNRQQQKHHKQNYMANSELRGQWNCFLVQSRKHTWKMLKQEKGPSMSLRGYSVPVNSLNTKIEPGDKTFSVV